MGDWKVVRQNLKNPEEEATIELYNLAQDPAELTNVAKQNPEIVQKAAQIFSNEHTNSEVEGFRIPLIENGLLSEGE
jgi:arylsulfatase A-like enzyme